MNQIFQEIASYLSLKKYCFIDLISFPLTEVLTLLRLTSKLAGFTVFKGEF